MSAPTISELLAGDISIEEVWASILIAAGVPALIAFSDGIKTTPYVEIEFEETAVTDHVFLYTVPGSDPVRLIKYRDCTHGSLVTRCCTTRGINSNAQKGLVGSIRAAAQNFAALFNTDVLPYHGINLFVETGLKRYVDPEERLDKTELRHRLHYNVRPEAWPV